MRIMQKLWVESVRKRIKLTFISCTVVNLKLLCVEFLKCLTNAWLCYNKDIKILNNMFL